MDVHRAPTTMSASTVAMVSGAMVVVETLLLGADGPRLTCRVREQALGDEEHPDVAARLLAGFDGVTSPGGALLHSTSWRFAAGRIVLTYAALPDPDPVGAATVAIPEASAHGVDGLSPSPLLIRHGDVIAHACRHLAFLHRTDPVVAAAADICPALWALIDVHQPGLAGMMHRTATLAA